MNSRLRPVLEGCSYPIGEKSFLRKGWRNMRMMGFRTRTIDVPRGLAWWSQIHPVPSSSQYWLQTGGIEKSRTVICRTRLTNWVMGSRLKPQSKGLALPENRLGFREKTYWVVGFNSVQYASTSVAGYPHHVQLRIWQKDVDGTRGEAGWESWTFPQGGYCL